MRAQLSGNCGQHLPRSASRCQHESIQVSWSRVWRVPGYNMPSTALRAARTLTSPPRVKDSRSYSTVVRFQSAELVLALLYAHLSIIARTLLLNVLLQTFAGVISLLNDFRISQGRRPLGFLNPFLYANPSAFNDITSGGNQGCGQYFFPSKISGPFDVHLDTFS